MEFWTNQRLALRVVGPCGALETTLDRPYARIGGHSTSDVVLQAADATSRGIYLHALDEQIFCLDLRQSQKPTRGFWLNSDSAVGIEDNQLRARLSGIASLQTRPGPALDERESAGWPPPVINIFHGNNCLSKRRLSSSLTLIGRWSQCGLQLKGKRVSGVHCALYCQSGRLWCIDLGSSNGTLVEGARIHCVELQQGERVEVGEFCIAFHRMSSKPRPELTTNTLSKLGGGLELQSLATTGSQQSVRGGGELAIQSQKLEQLNLQLRVHLHQIRCEAKDLADQAEKLSLLRRQVGCAVEPGPPATTDKALLNVFQACAAISDVKVQSKGLTSKQTVRLPGSVAVANYANSDLITCSARRGVPQSTSSRVSVNASLVSPLSTSIDPMSTAQDQDRTPLASVPDREENWLDDDACGSAPTFSDYPDPEPLYSLPVTSSEPATEATGPAKRPTLTGRSTSRTLVQRDSLVDYVSDRMVQLDNAKRRKRLVVGSLATICMVSLLLLAIGVWLQFGQQHLPMPRAIAKHIPAPMSSWLASVTPDADR